MVLRSLNICKMGVRRFSNNASLISVVVNDKTGVATLNMQRPPVNSLNLELISEISSALTDLENNKSRGLILTSKNDKVFSAGLDIMEMYKSDKDRMKTFWSTLQDTWIKLYSCSFPSVALINGHAPAGGCLLALSCEYRIMFKNYTIGLNETQLGMILPFWFINTMKNVIGYRQTEMALTTGNMFKTDEAFSIGMVDEIVETKEEGVARADAFINRFAKIPPMARALTKQYNRKETIDNMVNTRQEDLSTFITFMTQPAVQDSIGVYLQNLKRKSKA